MPYRTYTVTDEGGLDSWAVDVEADSPEWAAYLAAEKAYDHWAFEDPDSPFILIVEGTVFEIEIEFEPTFSVNEVSDEP